MDSTLLRELIARQRAGYSLESAFYRDAAIHALDLERLWRPAWIFAGHSCQLREPGEYFVVDIESDSIIVVRDDAGEFRALHNVCRHRGTRLLDDPSAGGAGRVGKIVCPYHQWVYRRDGRLVSCRGMHDDFESSGASLKPVALEVVEGFVFVSLAAEPPDFSAARAVLAPMLRPQGFERARVAKMIDYDVAANWKIVWENNRECYHCNANHPQYIRANFDHYNDDDVTPAVRERIADASRRSEERWRDAGWVVTHRDSGMTRFPDGDCWFSVNRTTLADGFVSETMSGRRVAPLMGEYTDPDVGTLRVRSVPNMWCHASCDHAVTTRLLPAGLHGTRVRVLWLVHEDAVEGKDYTLDELLPFWRLTSEQDWELCGRAQRGVLSSAYEPGELSRPKEYNVDAFLRWYLGRLAGNGGDGASREVGS